MAKKGGGEGDYGPVILRDFSGGLVSPLDREPDSLAVNETPDISNMDFDGRSSVKRRPGTELVGDRLTSAGSMNRSYTFRRAIINDEIAVFQRGTVLEYLHEGLGVRVPIKVTLTTGYTMGFAGYTSATDTIDKLYFCDGNIALQYWSGGHTQLNGALAGGEATVTVDSTAGLPAAGTIVIGTTDVTYTGITSTTFTGCSGTPAAANRAAVTDKPVNFSASSGSKPKGNILWVFNSQLFVGYKQFYAASDADDFTSWLPQASSLAHTKGFPSGTVQAIRSKDNKLIVELTDSVKYITYDFNSDLTGVQISVSDIEVSPNVGATSQVAIAQANGELYQVSLDGVIRSLVRSPNSSLIDINSISRNISNLVGTYNVDNASATFFRNKLYFAVDSGNTGINDTVFVFDFKYALQNKTKEAWARYDGLFVADWFVYNDALHFVSSAQPNVFRFGTSAVDGSELLTDDGAPIPWHYATPQFDFDMPEKAFEIGKVVARGFISEEAVVQFDGVFDYGTTSSQPVVLYGDNDENGKPWITVPAIHSVGEDVVGEEAVADAEDPFNGSFPFTFPFDYGAYDSYNIQVKVSGQTANEQFKLTRLILYIEPQADEITN